MKGFEKQSPFMQKRTLLEFVMIKKIIQVKNPLPLDEILEEAGLKIEMKEKLGHLLLAVAQNTVVFIHHQDLYNMKFINNTTHLNIFLECGPFYIEKWAKNIGLNDIYSFEHIPSDKKIMMIDELTESINFMKENLS